MDTPTTHPHPHLSSWALLSVLLSACAPTPPNAALRAKVEAGCDTFERCHALVAETYTRARECERAFPVRDCSLERTDEAHAKALLRPYERAEEIRRQREEAQRTAAEALQNEQQRTARSEELQRVEQLKREQQEAREAEQQRLQRAREVRSTTYAALGPDGRRAYLAACYQAGAEILSPEILEVEGAHATRQSCDRLLYLLVAASETDADVEALLSDAERRVDTYGPSVPVPTQSPTFSNATEGTGSDFEPEERYLLCCDGTVSPSCACGGPQRGCCSHHKGICGCTR